MYSDIVDVITKYRDICLFVHNSMDGDTLGTALALAFALEKMGKSPVVFIEEKIPDSLDILHGRRFTLDINNIGNDFSAKGKLAIAIDMADPKMLGKRGTIFDSFEFSINIDHHITNRKYGDINLILPDFAATAEIIYFIIKELGVEIDKPIAECIYAGICTDTGGFRFRNTTSQSHLIAAELLKFELDVVQMYFSFFEANTFSKIKITGYVSSTLDFYYGGKLAIAVIPLEVFQGYDATDEDSDGLVNIGRSVRGVEISILAREIKEGFFKVNFRSMGATDVSAIAAKFDGGGHTAASGCSLYASADEVKEILIQSVKNELNQTT